MDALGARRRAREGYRAPRCRTDGSLGGRNLHRGRYRVPRRSRFQCLPRAFDRLDPALEVLTIGGLEIKRASRGDQPERIVMSFQVDLRARMYIAQFQQSEKLILFRAFVIGQMRGSQHKPTFLPRLAMCNWH